MSLADSELLAIFDREVRRDCEVTRVVRETFSNLVRYTSNGPESQPILAKHGFRCLGYSNGFSWKPEEI